MTPPPCRHGWRYACPYCDGGVIVAPKRPPMTDDEAAIVAALMLFDGAGKVTHVLAPVRSVPDHAASDFDVVPRRSW